MKLEFDEVINMFENFDNFIYSSEDNFPKDECIV